MLSYRQIEILYLLIHEQTFIQSIPLLINLVYHRTIQYDIAYIEQYAETYHYHVSRNKAAGIKVTTANTTILNELEHNLTNQIHFQKMSDSHIAFKVIRNN